MPNLKFLRPKEYEILRAMAEAMIPHGGAFEPGADDVGVAEQIDGLLRYLQPDFRFGLRMLLRFLQISPVFSMKFTTFTRMSLEDRIAYIQKWEDGRFYPRRTIILLLKALVCLVFYSDPRVEASLGYSTGCVK